MKNKKCTTLSLLSSSPPPVTNLRTTLSLLSVSLLYSFSNRTSLSSIHLSISRTHGADERRRLAGERRLPAWHGGQVDAAQAGGAQLNGADEQWTVVWRGGRRSDRRDAGEQLLAGLWPRGVRRC